MTAQALENTEKSEKIDSKPQTRITCGIIMPIATMGSEYTAEHWEDVRAIIDTAVKRAGFEPRIVSDSEDSTIIHKSIINNIYNDEIIICDVSNKNANVMFELGMRLAFNKPVVIIKDDKTGYSFDTSNIEHIGYRKDLRHNTVEKFINDLSRKIKATYEAPKKEGYQPFLSHFGKFEVAKIENKSIEGGEALEKLLNKMGEMETQLGNLNITENNFNNKNTDMSKSVIYVEPPVISRSSNQEIIQEILKKIRGIHFVNSIEGGKALEITFNRRLTLTEQIKIEEHIKEIMDAHDDLPF
ncbi:hypothetical protein ACG94X_07100 [Acinetobacter sp. ULE_I010]|uniref:hypothetical protein n=1 Tax=Acinetobacter sp. ULE_I010 TaxID=3373065 RepID=UPI003AF6E1C3